MPIDPNLIGQLKPVGSGPTPFESYGQLLQLQGLKQQLDSQRAQQVAAQQAQQEQQAIGAGWRAALMPDGTFNRQALIANVAQGAPDHLPAILKELDAADAAALKNQQTKAEIAKLGLEARESQQKMDAADLDYFGALGQQVKAAQYDPSVFGIALAHAKANQHDVGPIEAMITQGASVRQIVDSVIAGSIKQRELATSEMNAESTRLNATKPPAPGPPVPVVGADGKVRYVTREASLGQQAPPTAQTGNAQSEQENAKTVAAGIIAGDTAPSILEGTRGTSQGLALMAEIKRQGGDSNQILRNWIGTKKAIGSLNSTQQIRLTEGIAKASASLDRIEELSNQLAPMMSRVGIKALNKANLSLAKNGAYGPEAASVATRLESQIADVTGELGTVIMGGGAPTDHGLELAKQNLSADWTQKTLSDAVKQVRYNLNLAQNARNDLLQGLGVESTQGKTPQSELPPASLFAGKPAGDYPATSPDGKTITVHWDGKTVTVK